MEGILYASREMELVKVFARRSVEQSFPTTRVLGYQNRVNQKSLARRDEISATDRIHTGAFAQERRFYFIFRLSRPFRRLLRECISYARSAAM